MFLCQHFHLGDPGEDMRVRTFYSYIICNSLVIMISVSHFSFAGVQFPFLSHSISLIRLAFSFPFQFHMFLFSFLIILFYLVISFPGLLTPVP